MSGIKPSWDRCAGHADQKQEENLLVVNILLISISKSPKTAYLLYKYLLQKVGIRYRRETFPNVADRIQ